MPCGAQFNQRALNNGINQGQARCGKCGKIYDFKDLTIKHSLKCGLVCIKCKQKYDK